MSGKKAEREGAYLAPVQLHRARLLALAKEARRLHCEQHKFLARIERAFAHFDRCTHQLDAVYRDLLDESCRSQQ
jgi:hypothetical protein